MILFRAFSVFALLAVAGSAAAHPGHESASFAAGFGHPLGGFDHLLAMLAVGLYAARLEGKARFVLPAAFVLAMVGGAAAGGAGLALPGVEAGIAASVLILGLMLAFAARLPLLASVPLVVVFALFHGHAHHAEMGDSTLFGYVAGFALATALLHGAGFLISRWMPETPRARLGKRIAGTAIAASGAVMLGA